MQMIRDFIAAVAISTIILVSLKLIVGLTVPVDLLMGRMYLMPMIPFNELTGDSRQGKKANMTRPSLILPRLWNSTPPKADGSAGMP
jgi:hypothetical protein